MLKGSLCDVLQNCHESHYVHILDMLRTTKKNELSLSVVTSPLIEPRLPMGVNVLCLELTSILDISAF